jgi:hypothetical protein
MPLATCIALPFWQDPQGDIVLVYSENECSIYFNCWFASGESADFIAHISFDRASAVRSYRREFLPYKIPSQSGSSYILSVTDSDLVRDNNVYRRQHYPHFHNKSSELQHFVVCGHDIYHEVLASSFTTRTIPNNEITHASLLRLIAAA